MENYTLEQAIATLEAINEQSLTSSIFSRQDVIRILKSIVVPEQVVTITEYQAIPDDYVERLIDELVDAIDSDDAIDLDTAEFEMRYNNTVELNSVDLDIYRIKRNMTDAYENIMDGIYYDIREEKEQQRIALEEAAKEQSEEVSTEEQENGQSNNNETTENNECQ